MSDTSITDDDPELDDGRDEADQDEAGRDQADRDEADRDEADQDEADQDEADQDDDGPDGNRPDGNRPDGNRPDGNRIVAALAKRVLEYVARSIVDDPESVIVEVEEGRRATVLRLHVSPGDMGRIIGRRGRVAQAIRTVVRAAGAREGLEVTVDIAD